MRINIKTNGAIMLSVIAIFVFFFFGASQTDSFATPHGKFNHATESLPSASSNACVPAPSGLISWWPGEGNFSDIQDGNTGTNAGAVTFTTGKVGQAFSFNGASNSFITLPNNSNLLPASNQFTIDAWIKPDFSASNVVDDIFNKRDGCSNGASLSYLLQVGKAGIEPFGFSPGEIIFVMSSGSGTVELGSGSTLIPNDGQFHHVAGTYDGAFMMIYLDGQLVGQAARTGAITVSTSPAVIGSNGGTCSQRSVAAIDEIDFFDRALTAQEIVAIYTGGSAGKCKECEPPTADAGDDQTICPGASVQIGGDPTGSGGTGTLSFSWEPADGLSAANVANPTAIPTSTTTYTVTVTDANGCTATAEMTVTVEDNQAPVITVAANPITLWPPNHQYVTINVSQCVTGATDNCALLSPSDVVVDSVTSDEPEDINGGGDGNTLNDIVIASDCKSVQLRRERQGGGNGRVYTLHMSVSDGNGNTGNAICRITVPKSQNGNPAIDDGPVYMVTGSCTGAAKLAESSDNATTAETLPEGYALFQNYPNPFNPSTVINFALPEVGKVTVRIYSETGQLVRALIDNEMAAGQHVVSWNGLNESGNTVAAGVYLYRIVVQKQNGETAFTGTRRMTFLK